MKSPRAAISFRQYAGMKIKGMEQADCSMLGFLERIAGDVPAIRIAAAYADYVGFAARNARDSKPVRTCSAWARAVAERLRGYPVSARLSHDSWEKVCSSALQWARKYYVSEKEDLCL